MPDVALDKIDTRILAELQENARLSNVDLAACVGLSQHQRGKAQHEGDRHASVESRHEGEQHQPLYGRQDLTA